jgi:hypothetical protein
VLCQKTFSSVFSCSFFTQLNCTVLLRVYGVLYIASLQIPLAARSKA